jgi:hypothetical protein
MNYHHPTRGSLIAPDNRWTCVSSESTRYSIKRKQSKRIERRNREDLSRYGGTLQIHHHSNGALELHPRGVPAECPEPCGPVIVHPERVLDRTSVPEITLEEYVVPVTLRLSLSTDQAARRRYQMPAPRKFVVSLQT